MARARFVQLNSTTRVNPDLVEGLSLSTAGGRETVWVHMMSGMKNAAPSKMSLDDVEKLLEGE